ncbi:RICIN domain-containing protein [Streptomyces odontomachi]|uniref:RICIN domain-containing protein n=1 Tax=Streptomyces odontomachi TaxID=2944940 RepID=UPI00210BAF46|nr:RICIN domain-containing protein [Streptomyces sp. ODS25]
MPRRTLIRTTYPVAALALAVSGLVVSASASPAGAASAPSAGSVYQLAVAASGRCIDVPSGTTDTGALLQQWGCSDATWQQFKVNSVGSGVYELANVNSGKCIDVPSGAATEDLQAQQWNCGTDKTNQQFTLTADGSGFRLKNVKSGLCLSVKGGSTSNGAAIVQNSCASTAAQQWTFKPVSAGRTWSDTADGFASTDGGTTGGAGGSTVTVTSYADLEKYAGSSSAYTIKVAASIKVPEYGHEIPVTSNKTLIGVGTSGEIVNGGLNLGTGVHNVIIRNLTIRDTRMADDDPDDKLYDYDGIQMDTADHVWIDHNHIVRMNDGLIDSRKDTSHLTVSWNNLGEVNKAFGIGWTDNVTARMTIHHNWIHDTNQRNPSTDNVALAHLYNNYMQNITSYGNYSRGSTKMVLENSYFDNVKNPYQKDDTAALTLKGAVVVNCSGNQQTGGTTFTPSDYYSYTLDPTADLPTLLKQYSGPQSNIGN